ncbi:hypothetical protein SAMN05421748_12698 [Paractinoplanes atraurantiacus]|uniref:Uncharacterized protein n=1 Tax=Paractinoplanes atraurantiacus TaxID=1036182 RepID=A0A285JVK4_9ACTN|nr:hypothetical protein SAMN05421748_12698 [Actinoplanes atraurantiacus]
MIRCYFAPEPQHQLPAVADCASVLEEQFGRLASSGGVI